ncbi:MAG TPA: SDR family oxidoreductase [Thermoanaerobaculia bacterium]|nr:SDR family oxidoreductase [Thermoanaerobaculia bacterium]
MIRVADGAWAVVTGASSGIGAAIAEQLAARKIPLVLVARSAGALSERAAAWRERHGIDVEALPLDLSRPGAAAALFDATEGRGRPVDLLVNGAGFGWNGPQAEFETARFLELLSLNVMATAELTHRFLVAMRSRRRGAILNVASTSAFFPQPFFAAYGASKAFILSFTHALHEEAKRDGVTVTALCPGYTRTKFHEVAGMRGAEGTPFPEMTAARVAERGLTALGKGRAVVVTHGFDRLWIAMTRVLPRSVPPRLAAAFFTRTRL